MTKNGPQIIDQDANLANKLAVREFLQKISASDKRTVKTSLEAAYHENAIWRGSHPLNEVQGAGEIAEKAWKPLLHAFPDLERRDEIFVGGRYTDKYGDTNDLVACVGHYCATFKNDFLEIPANGQPIWLRYGEVHEINDGKITRSSCLWDILDLIRQAGFWPLAPSWGREGRWSGPITCDGLVFSPQEMDIGMTSIQQTLAMHQTLGEYKDHELKGRKGLIDMPQKEHWHEKMMWYGPSGIGTTRLLEGFVDFHQLPFRLTWPSRVGGQTLTARKSEDDTGHYIQIGDGPYSVTGGWPSVVAINNGAGDVFGCGPTGKEVEMRVMDFYLHHEGKIRENWVPIDVIHLLLQQGVDIMQRVKDQFGRNRFGLR